VSAPLWVTGLGLITPLGVGVEATWSRLVRGDRAIRDVSLFDAAGQRAAVAGQVDGAALSARAAGLGLAVDPAGGVAAPWSRTSAMAAVAAAEAIEAAGIDVRAERVGLVVGGTTGGMFENEQVLARLHAEPECRELLVQMLSHPLTATGDCLEQRFGPFARVRTLASACSSGANAIVLAAAWLLAGDVDVVVAGGADGLCRLTLTGFNALGALDPEPCRPFDRRRRGTSLGEGAAFVVLERADGAGRRARGPRPLAELAGWAAGAEAHHITNPAADGALVASLIARAIACAGLAPGDVDYVNAHGTGTPLNDAMEATALRRALGGDVERIPVSSSKGQIGHTLGGAGAIEAAITALVVSRRTLVPTAGLDEPDPALSLVHVPHAGREVPRVRAALSNAFGFGGMDTVLVFTEPELARRRDARAARAAPPASTARGPAREAGAVVTGAAVFGACGLLGTAECAALPERRFDLDGAVDPDPHLSAARARRLDHASRLAAVAVQRALADAGAGADVETGVLLGSAYGNVDASAAFMHRIFDKGPRTASPADFPNLVPSSPAGHVSIYLGLHGPTLTTADLAASGESAVVQAVQLVAGGFAARLVAGAVEPRSDIVGRVLAALFAHTPSQSRVARTDTAAAVVVESELGARAAGTRILARFRQVLEWRGDAAGPLASLSPPGGGRAECVLPRPDETAKALIARSGWAACPVRCCSPSIGESDALGAVAVAVAAARIASGLLDEALVIGIARGRGYAIALGR